MAAKQKLTRVNWIYDEIVLVADVLSRNNWKYIEPTSEAALQLSTLLRDGILHGDRVNHPSELPDSFFAVPALWVHGHTHTSHDYRVGRCRIVCNPRGYQTATMALPENRAFRGDRVLTLDAGRVI